MASIDPNALRQLAQAIAAEIGAAQGTAAGGSQAGKPSAGPLGDGVYTTIDEAVGAARRGFFAYERIGLGARYKIIDAIRQVCRQQGRALAEFAHSETGLGRVEDKVIKNQVVTEHTPGPEILEPIAASGDKGLMLTEPAPFGVIGAITPVTNPTSTII